jgi:hypothetical protein
MITDLLLFFPPTITDNIPLQIASLFLVAMSVGLMCAIVYRERALLMWFVLPVLWVLHGIVFYTWLFLDRYTDLLMAPLFGSYTMWSSVLRFQTYLTVFLMLVTFLTLQIIHQRKYGPK